MIMILSILSDTPLANDFGLLLQLDLGYEGAVWLGIGLQLFLVALSVEVYL